MTNKSRQKEDIKRLRGISAPTEGGITRVSYTASYREAADYIKKRMHETGLLVHEDEVGNIHGILKGTHPNAPSILCGSHLDTVRNAGAFDGVAGVVCALEAARQIKEQKIDLHHSLEVIAFIEEEGTSTDQFMLGSRFMTGDLTDQDKDWIRDENGVCLRQILDAYLGDAPVTPACRKRDKFLAFLELHDEQGPVLYETQTNIGIVDRIVSLAQLTITIKGEAGHAGTVPMHMRHDAGLAAAQLIYQMSSYTKNNFDDAATTLTVGKITFFPHSSNCIPGRSSFTVDLRAAKKSTIERITRYIEMLARKAEEEHDVIITTHLDTIKESVELDKTLQQIIQKNCKKLGLSYRFISSGAGHDAMIMADLCPAAMIFIPCEKGITHHPDEKVEWVDMERGTALLLATIQELDTINS